MKDLEIGKRIREIRQSYGMTQKEFGLEIGKTAGYISLLERGNIYSDNILEKISEKFEVDNNWLREGIGQGPSLFSLDEKEIAEGIEERIKCLRKMAGLTREQLANYLECPGRRIVAIESGEQIPTIEFLRLFAERMNVPLSYIVSGHEIDGTWFPPEEIVDDEVKEIVLFMLTHKKVVKRIKDEIEQYLKENDNKDVTLGAIIRKMRNEKGLTQQELGELIGCSKKVVGSYEENRARPSLELMLQMSNVLEVELEKLIDIQGVAMLSETT